MAVNVEVEKNKNENNMSVIKRFNRRIQESGVLRKVRSIRYADRKKSDFVKKKNKLNSLEKRAKFEELYKMGKIANTRKRRR